jgi:hypothetical protein
MKIGIPNDAYECDGEIGRLHFVLKSSYLVLWVSFVVCIIRRSMKIKARSVDTSYERTFSTVKLLLSLNSIYKLDPSEVWKTAKGQVPLSLSVSVIDILASDLVYNIYHVWG